MTACRLLGRRVLIALRRTNVDGTPCLYKIFVAFEVAPQHQRRRD